MGSPLVFSSVQALQKFCSPSPQQSPPSDVEGSNSSWLRDTTGVLSSGALHERRLFRQQIEAQQQKQSPKKYEEKRIDVKSYDESCYNKDLLETYHSPDYDYDYHSGCTLWTGAGGAGGAGSALTSLVASPVYVAGEERPSSNSRNNPFPVHHHHNSSLVSEPRPYPLQKRHSHSQPIPDPRIFERPQVPDYTSHSGDSTPYPSTAGSPIITATTTTNSTTPSSPSSSLFSLLQQKVVHQFVLSPPLNSRSTSPSPQSQLDGSVENKNLMVSPSLNPTTGLNGRPAHRHRKSTVSQLPPFLVSAPAKLIVFGEHAVVHKKASIAAALSLRSYLLVTPLPKHNRTITLKFPDIGIDQLWNIDDLPWDIFHNPEKKQFYFNAIQQLDSDLEDALEPHLYMFRDDKTKKAAKAFLYLYLSLGDKHACGAVYSLRSTIPIGAGLGSSASVSVCLSTALQLQMGTLATPFNGMKPHETQLQLKRINNWAFVGEMCIHNFPSGVDNTVATGGKAVYFKRPNYQKPPQVKFLKNFPELPLLLVNTRQSRATSKLVASVTKLIESHSEIAGHLLDAIDKVSEEANEIITSEDFSPTEKNNPEFKRLLELVRINHGLLVSLGVSHPKLERIRELTEIYDVGATKLTGAGGGGCSFTLLKPNVKHTQLEELEAKLAEEGFEKYETTLGGHGVGVMWPAARNFGDGKGEVEITTELHLAAKGFGEVEALVGSSGPGWRYWSEWDPDVLNPLS